MILTFGSVPEGLTKTLPLFLIILFAFVIAFFTLFLLITLLSFTAMLTSF